MGRDGAEFPASKDWIEPGGNGLVPTRALLRNRSCARVLEQVRRVRHFFPELEKVTIRVGLTRAADGYASIESPAIWLNPRRLAHHTIAHEMIHLLQSRGLVPGGEKSADLHALARHVVLADALPGYLAVPNEMRYLWDSRRPEHRRLLCGTARDALVAGAGSYRRSIRIFEERLPGRWTEGLEGRGAGEASIHQPSLFETSSL